MDKTTADLLEKLAAKLGTTAQYLWMVLIKQAQISAIRDMIYIILITVLGICLWRLHKRLCKEDKDGDSVYETGDGVVIVPMLFAGLTFCIFGIWAFFAIGDVFSAFLNPEYWALKQVLETVK